MKINRLIYVITALGILTVMPIVYAQGAIDAGLIRASQFGLPDVDLITFITRLVRVFLSIIILIVVLMIILSGLKWMLAGGDEEKIKKARGAFFNAIIGLIIVFASYAIVSFVINLMVTATS